MKIGYYWSDKDKRKMTKALEELRVRTPKEAWNMLGRLANYTAFSAEKATKIGQRQHEVVKAQNATEARQLGVAGTGFQNAGPITAIKFYHQDKAPTWYYYFSHQKAEIADLRKIEYRGLAKSTWRSIKGKLGNVISFPSAMIARVARGVTWVKFKRGNAMFILFTNRLQYMSIIHPTVLSDSIGKAERRMVGMEKDRIEKEMKRVWRRAA